MLIEIEDLKSEPLEIRHEYSAGQIRLDHEGSAIEGPIRTEFVLTHDARELEVKGSLSTSLRHSCSRCLKEFREPLVRSFDLLYRPNPKPERTDEEIEIHYDEMEVGFYDGIRFDVDLMILEQVELSIPMKLICSEGCKGLCPACGADLNRAPCGCAGETRDSRLAALLEFRKKMDT